MASGSAVLKNMALQKPATLIIADREAAIFTSLVRNCARVRALSVPRASPRITKQKNGQKAKDDSDKSKTNQRVLIQTTDGQ